jgi:exosortase D (VPLPA-CTERM-specific)
MTPSDRNAIVPPSPLALAASPPADVRAAVWRDALPMRAVTAVAALALAFLYFDALRELWRVWGVKDEYSYGYVVPLIAAFLLWQKRDAWQQRSFRGSWAGLGLTAVGLCLFVLGELSTLYLIVQYSMLVVLFGLVLAYAGWPGLRTVAVPLAFLAFMIPLPQFFLQEISAALQLLSSQMGVAVIRLFGISVHLEGNVIDLGGYRLQVVEACNGLRYLFPLMTLGFLSAYLFRAPWWARALVFLSTIPITVVMNSVRIGIIGVLVEYWGTSMAEGFLHDFEGWAVFMVCVGVLLAEMWLLTKLLDRRRSFADAFSVELPGRAAAGTHVRSASRPYLVAVTALIVTAIAASAFGTRADAAPASASFAGFPAKLGNWQGQTQSIEPIYLDELKLTDYVLSDYRRADTAPVNLYAAYYGSQRKGESSHSPRTCIPGGGWRIAALAPYAVNGVRAAGQPLVVNRVQIERGDQRMLVYYWFQQRGRVLTDEYAVKWYIFQDALTRQRTDGAMLRLSTVLDANEEWNAADRRLTELAGLAAPQLDTFIPP